MKRLPFKAQAQLAVLAAFFGCSSPAGAVDASMPRIDLIEKFGKDQVTIHFYTAAGRAYSLQACDGSPPSAADWKTLFTLPAVPFVNHYVLVDWATNSFRVYRLSVTR